MDNGVPKGREESPQKTETATNPELQIQIIMYGFETLGTILSSPEQDNIMKFLPAIQKPFAIASLMLLDRKTQQSSSAVLESAFSVPSPEDDLRIIAGLLQNQKLMIQEPGSQTKSLAEFFVLTCYWKPEGSLAYWKVPLVEGSITTAGRQFLKAYLTCLKTDLQVTTHCARRIPRILEESAFVPGQNISLQNCSNIIRSKLAQTQIDGADYPSQRNHNMQVMSKAFVTLNKEKSRAKAPVGDLFQMSRTEDADSQEFDKSFAWLRQKKQIDTNSSRLDMVVARATRELFDSLTEIRSILQSKEAVHLTPEEKAIKDLLRIFYKISLNTPVKFDLSATNNQIRSFFLRAYKQCYDNIQQGSAVDGILDHRAFLSEINSQPAAYNLESLATAQEKMVFISVTRMIKNLQVHFRLETRAKSRPKNKNK